jgi:hypothetical protein
MQNAIRFSKACRLSIATVGLAALICIGVGAGDEPKQVTVEQLNDSVTIIGSLGQPLGTYIKIEGNIPDQPILMANPLAVDTVNGKKLDKPILIEIHTSDQFKKNVRYQFRGYETGGMVSTPTDPEDHSGNPGPQVIYHFAVWFVPVAPAPASDTGSHP